MTSRSFVIICQLWPLKSASHEASTPGQAWIMQKRDQRKDGDAVGGKLGKGWQRQLWFFKLLQIWPWNITMSILAKKGKYHVYDYWKKPSIIHHHTGKAIKLNGSGPCSNLQLPEGIFGSSSLCGPGQQRPWEERPWCMFCVCLMHLWSLMWTLYFYFLGGGEVRETESMILQRAEGKDIGKGARQKIAFSIEED